MHDAGAVVALQAAKVLGAAMSNEGVGQRVIHMARTRVADKPLLLGKDDQVVILVADVERNVGIGRERGVRRSRVRVLDRSADTVAKQHLLRLGGRRRLVDGDLASLHELGTGGA